MLYNFILVLKEKSTIHLPYLVGDQKKLDKNNDGKISGEDFKMMMDGGKVEYMDGGKMYDEGGSIEEIIGSLSKAELKELYQMLLNR